MSTGKKIVLRVFLEGLEIPCFRAVVQSSIGAPAVATIDVPAATEFFDRYEEDPPNSGNFVQKEGVQPRTLVHIFYEDSDDPDQVPRLLFEGEFVRYEYTKTKNDRVLRLIARDVSNILSSIYVRYYSDFFTPYAGSVSVFTGQSTTSRPNTESIRLQLLGGGTGINAEVMNAIQKDPNGFGISAAFKDIVATALKTNTFFTKFANRTKVVDKIASLSDVTIKKLLDSTVLASLVFQNMSNLKESASVWDLYTMLMGLVYYFPVPIAAAPYIDQPVVDSGSADKGSKQHTISPAKNLISLLLKPYTWWTAPPTFNVIFPTQYKTFNSRRDFLSEPTRIMMSAFGVIESLAQEELKSFAPSQYLFIAPRALADRFNREAYDSQFQNVATSKSVKAAEDNITALQEQKRQVEIKIANPKLTAAQKSDLRNQDAALDTSILKAQTDLSALVQSIKAQGDIWLAKEAPKAEKKVQVQLWNRSVLTDQDNVSLASREDLKGIVFGFDYLTQTQVEVSKSKGISPTALKDYLSNIADYKLSIQQHKDRISEMSMIFSPQLVPGFPALVVDPVQSYFGELDVVTHIMDAQGMAETQAQVSFVRNSEVEFSDVGRNTPGNIQFPAWINPSYLPSFIGSQVYQKLFPKNKPDASKPGIPAADSILAFAPTRAKNQIAAASRIRQLYFNAKNQERFATNFTRRNIASMDQTFQVLGATKNGSNYVLNSFSDERYKSVAAYAAAARKVRVDATSDSVQGANA